MLGWWSGMGSVNGTSNTGQVEPGTSNIQHHNSQTVPASGHPPEHRTPNFYPVNINLEGQPCLVVGGGSVARRKIGGLLECGAVVTVVSPVLTPELNMAAARGDFCYNEREFHEDDLERKFLVITATGNYELNVRIAQLCRDKKILVNVVDSPGLCSFFVPAVVRRGPICISIGTGGSSPLLARRIREDLEGQFGPAFEEIANLLAELRRDIQERLPAEDERRKCWDKIVTRELIELLKTGNTEIARKRVERACTSLLSE
jgi:siroheme synthase-like protein